ncbi:MAG: hypothetical protein Q4A08_09230 [Bacteroidales bacterium]|nr:hypothetical protein [Bacteroidales bacterium]
MKKEYIKPQIKEHPICACRLMTSSPTTIEEGDPLNGGESGGIYVE